MIKFSEVWPAAITEEEITLEEAIQRLKAEILAPDWRLNQRRAQGVQNALAVVEATCRDRRSLLGVIGMVRAAMKYSEARDWAAPPGVLDFFKQALAHLVAMLEEDLPRPEREAELFEKLYERFNRLKVQLAAGTGGKAGSAV